MKSNQTQAEIDHDESHTRLMKILNIFKEIDMRRLETMEELDGEEDFDDDDFS